MIIRRTCIVLAALATTTPLSAQEARTGPLTNPFVTARVVTTEAQGVKISYLNVPWQAQLFEEMTTGRTSTFTAREWYFASMDTTVPLTVDGVRLAPGSYATMLHPNRDGRGMLLELRRLSGPQSLESGRLAEAPEGESVYRAPVAFSVESAESPRLAVTLTAGQGQCSLVVRYGDRKLVKELKL